MEWEPVIGLEVHTQLATKSKIFSGASTAYGAEPNTQACAIDLALPGVLPVLNEKAITLAIRFGLAIQAKIPPYSIFARKNYFYPDLPKGYQISQYELPIISQGSVNIILDDGSEKMVGITRAHLEEDAGKSIHGELSGCSGIDLNRASTPLLEIVSEPELYSAKEAVAYLKTLHNLVRYLGISDGNMQEGSFRCDVNVSLKPKGSAKLGTRTELKNLNSFRFVERAILYEIQRQINILDGGGTITQETRLYDPDKDETRTMRSKEEAHDYRYFPDPDLLPVTISTDFIESVRSTLPELPWEKCTRFQQQYELNRYDANLLSNNIEIAKYFEDSVQAAAPTPAKIVANWINGDLAAALNKSNLSMSASPIQPQQLGALLQRITDNTVSTKMAKEIFEAMWQGEGSADQIIAEKGLQQISDSSELEKVIAEVIAQNPSQAEEFRAGKDKLITFFVGQIMKATRGKANPQQVNEILLRQLQKKE